MPKETLPPSTHEHVHTPEEQYTDTIHEHRLESSNETEIPKERDPATQQETLDDAKILAEQADKQREMTDNQNKSPAERRLSGAPSKKKRQAAYDATLKEIRSEMTPGEKVASTIIHNKVVEPVSDFVGATIARPNAMLSGSIAAFIAVTVVYFVAKNYGYQLSGFETIGAFIAGWLLGIFYDYISTLLQRGKHK